MEGDHVVVCVSLMRNGYEYGTVPDRRGTIHTESGDVVNSVSRMRSHPESYAVAMNHAELPSTALTSDDLDTPPVLFVAVLFIYGITFYTCSICPFFLLKTVRSCACAILSSDRR